MAEILGAGFVTLTDLVNAVRVAVGDTVSTNRKWSTDQVYLGIKNGLAQAGNNFFVQGEYTSLALVVGTLEYTLPDYVQRVRTVKRERRSPDIQVNAGTTLDYEELHGWTQHRTPGANKLFFDRATYAASNTIIFYERDVTIPLVDLTLTSNIASNATSATFTFPGSYNIYELDFPAYFQINNAEIVQVSAVTAPSTVTISRGQLGTAAAAATAGDTVTPVLVENDDRLEMFLVNSAAAYLNMLMLQNANRGADVAGNLTAMREFQQLAQDLLKKKSVRPQPRPIRPERQRVRRTF